MIWFEQSLQAYSLVWFVISGVILYVGTKFMTYMDKKAKMLCLIISVMLLSGCASQPKFAYILPHKTQAEQKQELLQQQQQAEINRRLLEPEKKVLIRRGR